ncbi:MAG: hypothetical protein GX111_04545 [Clostridiales bacterium]|nr:hypothetical protein [Clostridiales bacterium]
MDMRKFTEGKTGGIDQFCPPLCFELAGQSFYFEMDDGFDYELKFIDEKTLEWNFAGKEPAKADYLCVKGDETTYLLSFDLQDVQQRENHTFVIDKENWLCTRILSRIGDNPRYPYLIAPKYEFGAIKREGVEYRVYPRHGFTDDLNGNVVQWNYGMMETVHIYYCSDYYRITYPPEKASAQSFNEALQKLPSSDEPTAYIKIKEGMYLFSLTESNAEKLIAEAMGFRSNTMCMLQNYKRVYQVGRTFGTATRDGVDTPLHLMFGAYGRLRDIDSKFLTDPNPYLI